jgi:hypothetical protein
MLASPRITWNRYSAGFLIYDRQRRIASAEILADDAQSVLVRHNSTAREKLCETMLDAASWLESVEDAGRTHANVARMPQKVQNARASAQGRSGISCTGQVVDEIVVEEGVSGSVPVEDRSIGGRLFAKLERGDIAAQLSMRSRLSKASRLGPTRRRAADTSAERSPSGSG